MNNLRYLHTFASLQVGVNLKLRFSTPGERLDSNYLNLLHYVQEERGASNSSVLLANAGHGKCNTNTHVGIRGFKKKKVSQE